MFIRKNQIVWWGILFLVLFLFLVKPFGLEAAQNKGPQQPAWWDWGKKYWPTAPVRGGYFRKAAVTYIGLMNPNHWPVTDWVTIGFFYDKLLNTDGNFRPLVPWLAESWEFLDPVTVTMKLRRGVKFHDGSDFNAETLKYHIEWIMDKKNGAWTRAWLKPIKAIEVSDEYTVTWRFNKPWAGFLGTIANIPGYIISMEALKGDVAIGEAAKATAEAREAKRKAATEGEEAKLDADKAEEKARQAALKVKDVQNLDTHPVGAGPYILEEANPGSFVKIKRNPNWWFGRSIGRPDMPYFDGMITTVIPDPSVQLANLKAGKLDQMGIPKSMYDMIKSDPKFKTYAYNGNHIYALGFNHAKGPCQDIRVRKAISHAVDRKALIAGTQFGLALVASCMYPKDHWCHNPDLKPISYDPELSKKLLAEAGYPNGLRLEGFVSNASELVTVGEAIKGMLAKVGIDWKMDTLDEPAIDSRTKNLEYDLVQSGWIWIYDPDLPASARYHPSGSFNFGRSHNEKAIALIEAGREEMDLKKRQKIYFELEKALYENYEDAWLFWPMDLTVLRKNVLGWNLDLYLKGREGYFWSHPQWFEKGRP
jgi:peptide/nickel transport system substrate-binding protein